MQVYICVCVYMEYNMKALPMASTSIFPPVERAGTS